MLRNSLPSCPAGTSKAAKLKPRTVFRCYYLPHTVLPRSFFTGNPELKAWALGIYNSKAHKGRTLEPIHLGRWI